MLSTTDYILPLASFAAINKGKLYINYYQISNTQHGKSVWLKLYVQVFLLNIFYIIQSTDVRLRCALTTAFLWKVLLTYYSFHITVQIWVDKLILWNCESHGVVSSGGLQYAEGPILSSLLIEFVSGYIRVCTPPISLGPPSSLACQVCSER